MPCADRRLPTRQRGAVAIIFALVMMFVLLGIGALVLDLGRMFVAKSELQNATDACALAAASQLRPTTSDPNALTRAVAYGRSMTRTDLALSASYRNLTGFQNTEVAIDADQISFSNTDLATTSFLTIAGGAALNSRYAKCEATVTVPVLLKPAADVFVGASGGPTRQVYAMAVATLGGSQSSCAIPLGVCKGPGGNPGNNWGLTPGQWVTGRECTGSHCDFSTSNASNTGNFGWLDFTPPAGGASEIRGWIAGNGYCGASVGQPVGNPGVMSSLNVAWNARFGLYKNGGGNPTIGDSPPDPTGYAYAADNWPAQSNAYAGSGGIPNYQSARAGYLPYQTDVPSGFNLGGYNTIDSAAHLASGRNRRIVAAPIVDCSVWANDPNGNPPIDGFACVLMIYPLRNPTELGAVEYLGVPGTISECASAGVPGGTSGNLTPVLVQ